MSLVFRQKCRSICFNLTFGSGSLMQPFQLILKTSRSLAAECLALLLDFVHREVSNIPIFEERYVLSTSFVNRESESMCHRLNYCCAALTTFCSRNRRILTIMLRLLTTLEAWMLFSSPYVPWWSICLGETFFNNYSLITAMRRKCNH